MIKVNRPFCKSYNKHKIYSIILLFSFIIFFYESNSKERQIYVGDLMEIEVSSTNLTKDTLTEKFIKNDFEIVNIIENKNNFVLTLRTFKTGEKKIELDGNELVINVESTLDDIKQEKLFEGKHFFSNGNFSLNLNYLLITLICSILLIFVYNLWVYLKNRKRAKFDPYAAFVNRINNLSKDDINYFVILTAEFKKYIEAKFACKIKGKTSSEIIKEIINLSNLEAYIDKTKKWLEFCDHLKFKDLIVNIEEKQELQENLVLLVKNIEEDMR